MYIVFYFIIYKYLKAHLSEIFTWELFPLEDNSKFSFIDQRMLVNVIKPFKGVNKFNEILFAFYEGIILFIWLMR